jgi:LytS/YehU family sensor histidine kinase
MKGIGKDNAKVIAAKKSLSTTGKLDQVNLAQQKYERANIFSDTVNAIVSKSKTFKNKNKEYGEALKEIASSQMLKNKAEIRSAMFKKKTFVDLLAKKITNENSI